MKPPEVAARFVLLDGIVMAILSRSVDGVCTTVAQYGLYTLDANEFAYCYTDRKEFPAPSPTLQAGDPEGIRFEGLRNFVVDAEPGCVRLRSSSSERGEFLFTTTGLTYSERGTVLRKWQRASVIRERLI